MLGNGWHTSQLRHSGAVVTAHSRLPCHTHYTQLGSHRDLPTPPITNTTLYQQKNFRDAQRISLRLAEYFTMLFSDWWVNIIIKYTVQ